MLMDFLVGREWEFYMSKSKHLLEGERIAKVGHARTVFFRFASVIETLRVMSWEDYIDRVWQVRASRS